MKELNLEKYLQELDKAKVIIKELIKDIAVLSADEFDKNFDREAFFTEKWESSKYVERENRRMSEQKGKSWKRKILQKTGALRKSIRYVINGHTISFGSALPYAKIHNEGGNIKHPGGTAYIIKDKKAIWISNREAYGKKYPRTKAHTITIRARPFVGEHRQLIKEIERLVEGELGKLL